VKIKIALFDKSVQIFSLHSFKCCGGLVGRRSGQLGPVAKARP